LPDYTPVFEDEETTDPSAYVPVYEDEPPPPEKPAKEFGLIDQLIGGYYDFRSREATADAVERLQDAADPKPRRVGQIKGEPQFVNPAGGSLMRAEATPEEASQYRQEQVEIARGNLETAAEFGEKGANIPLSPEVLEFLDENSGSTVWEAFKKAPVKIIVELGARSGAASTVSVAGGVVGGTAGSVAGPVGTATGFAAGMGATSARLEYASSLVEGLRTRGVDVSDESALQKAIEDKALMQEVQKEATIRAAAIGGVDAIAGLVGAKHFTPGIRSVVVRELANLGVQAPAQAGLGATGEALAQKASGQELNTREIAAEAAGELITAPVDVAAAAAAGARSTGQTAADDVDGPIKEIEAAQERARQAVAERGGDALDQEMAAAQAGAEISARQDEVKSLEHRRIRMMQKRADAEAERLAAAEPVKPRPGEAAFRAEQRAQRFPEPGPDTLLGRRNAEQSKVDADAERIATDEAYKPVFEEEEAARQATYDAAAARYATSQGFAQAEETQTAQKTREEAEAFGQREMQKAAEIETAPSAPTLADVAPPELLSRRRGDETIANAEPSVAARAKVPVVVDALSTDARVIEKPKTLAERKAAQPEMKALPAPKPAGFVVDSAGAARAVTEAEVPKPRAELTLTKKRVERGLIVREINKAADEAATSPRNNLPEPTEAQKQAGNYKKGHLKLHGMDISIENPRGSLRTFTRADGSTGARRMRDNYGYIRRTEGADGDQVDIFVSETPTSDKVFVIDQLKQSGGFDEHKALLGYPDEASAVRAYKRNYQPGWQVGPVKEMTVEEFKEWVRNGDTKAPLQPEKIPTPASPEQLTEATENQKPGRRSKLRYADSTDPLDRLSRASSETIERMIKQVQDQHVNKELTWDQYTERVDPLITAKVRAEKREREAAGKGKRGKVFRDMTVIPVGTKIKGHHGLKITEPTMGTVIGTKLMQLTDGLYSLPIVDFGDGKRRTLAPHNIDEVFAPRAVPDKPRYAAALPDPELTEDAEVADLRDIHEGKATDSAIRMAASRGEATEDGRLTMKGMRRLRGTDATARRLTEEQPAPAVREEHRALPFTQVGKKQSIARAEQVLAPLMKELPGLAPTILNKPSDAPASLRQQMEADGQYNARGVYDPETDTVYVFAGNHSVAEEIVKTAIHEGVAHKGLRHLLTTEFEPAMRDVWENAKSTEWMADFLDQHGMQPTPENQVIAAEEFAASLAEQGIDAGILQRVIDAIRKALRKLGIVKQWSDDDIRALLRDSRTGLRDVSTHASSAKLDKRPRYARSEPDKRADKAPESPLAVLHKQAAAMEDQANYNPGFVRSRLDALRDIGQNNIETLLAFIPRRNLPDFIAPGKMDSMRKYLRVAQHMDGRRNELLTETDATAKRWMAYTSKNKAGGRILGELMHAATLATVDPAETYASLKNPKSMTPEDKAEDAQRRQQYAILRRYWDRLDAEGKAVYLAVRESYKSQRTAIEKALEERIAATQADGKTKQALTLLLRQKFEEGRVRGPYFPLSRFGDYWAVARDKEGTVVSFSKFESPTEQRAWVAEMRRSGYETDAGKKMEDKAMLQRIDPTFVSKVTRMAEGVDKSLADEIWQLYLRTMPEMSMRKHFVHRKGRLGFSADALRAFGNTMFHGAHQLAKLENMYQMEQHLDAMKVEARTIEQAGGADAKWAAPLVKEMDKRHEWARNPMSSALATKLTSLGFAWYLGASLSSALVNMTQTAIVGFPTLAAKFNWLGAGAELMKAAALYAGSRGPLANRLRGDERAAFDEAKRIGLFDQTQAHDLAGLSQEGLDYTSKGRKAMELLSWFFHRAEEFNRQTTFLAAYRLARKKGMSHSEAIDTGEDLTWDSHFNYSNVNRARVLQSDTAKVLLLFRQYSANMTYRLARDFNDSLRGSSPTAKREARKRLGGILGMTGLFAGVTGLPMFWVVEMVGNAIFGDEDEPFDTSDATRAYLAEMYGPKMAEAIMKGPVDAVSGATVSSRVGLNNLWVREAPAGVEGEEYAMHLLKEFAGPLPGIAIDAFAAATLGEAGYEERAIERVTPKPIRDLAKTARYLREGVTTLRGDEIMKREDFTTRDAFMQASGFTPSDLTMRYEQNRAVKRAESAIIDRRAILMDRLFLAVRNDDPTGVREAMADINRFNSKNPRIAIRTENIMSSAKTRARYSNEAVNGVTVDPHLYYLHDKLNFSREKE
jgi:hypothetical protein